MKSKNLLRPLLLSYKKPLNKLKNILTESGLSLIFHTGGLEQISK